METDPVFKTPVKRKKGRVRSAASKQAKQGERGDDTDTDDGQSDSGWSMSSQEDTSSTVYTADEIKAFLQRTKGQKLVQVTGCISDWSQLVHDVGHFRRKAFTELELYRLKKLLTRLRKESTDDGHAVGCTGSLTLHWAFESASASEMDAPSKFFFGLEQKNGQRRFVHAVRTESGDFLSEPAEIRKWTVTFFSKLYNRGT
ncbi:hypothetical protein NFI96_004290 [Prochilodus magdalenae]|nr:hypothetical protein NFI96_004290 [Prochilodus magdalenae]